jgi:sugar lactone lactonase YvrE
LAQLSYPLGVSVDSSGNVYIADDFNGVIRKVDTLGNIATFATNADFGGLGVIAMDSSNNLYVVDQGTCVIWKITPAAVVTVYAGVEFSCGYNGDNTSALTAQLNIPVGVAVDTRGNIYIADYNNHRVRKVNASGIISTLAGDGNCGFTGDGGLGTSAELCFPEGVAVTTTGTLYIADTGNIRIRKLTAGIISTYAGSGISGFNGDGPALSVNFDDPVAVTVNSSNMLYMLDDVTERVRKIH